LGLFVDDEGGSDTLCALTTRGLSAVVAKPLG
jgi:hypothetical protein